MATSGVVGSYTVAFDDLMREAALRCGRSPGELTSEQLQSCRFGLFSYLSNLSNHGVNLWCVEKTVIGLNVAQAAYALPVGTVDVLNATYRTVNSTAVTASSSAGGTAANAFDRDMSTACTQTSTNGNISGLFAASTRIATIGIMPNASSTWNLIWERSDDGATWTSVYAPGSVSYTAGEWAWADIDAPVGSLYFRVRETGGGTLDVRELVFGTVQTEVVLARLNRDDYVAQPNKNQTGQPLQYWFDRQRTQPRMVTWPTPDNAYNCIIAWRHRHIQDVGALTNEIEIPQRWTEAIASNLAARLALILPNFDMNRVAFLQQMADKATYEAEQEERDDSPIYFAPNLSVYTR